MKKEPFSQALNRMDKTLRNWTPPKKKLPKGEPQPLFASHHLGVKLTVSNVDPDTARILITKEGESFFLANPPNRLIEALRLIDFKPGSTIIPIALSENKNLLWHVEVPNGDPPLDPSVNKALANYTISGTPSEHGRVYSRSKGVLCPPLTIVSQSKATELIVTVEGREGSFKFTPPTTLLQDLKKHHLLKAGTTLTPRLGQIQRSKYTLLPPIIWTLEAPNA